MNIEKKKPGCLAQTVMFVALMSMVGWCSYSADQEKRNETPEIRREKYCGRNGRSDAAIVAQFFIKEKLKAPSTASFASNSESNVIVAGECEFIIRSYLDAQNSFGAKLRSDYYVNLKYDPIRKTYILLGLRLGDQFYQ